MAEAVARFVKRIWGMPSIASVHETSVGRLVVDAADHDVETRRVQLVVLVRCARVGAVAHVAVDVADGDPVRGKVRRRDGVDADGARVAVAVGRHAVSLLRYVQAHALLFAIPEQQGRRLAAAQVGDVREEADALLEQRPRDPRKARRAGRPAGPRRPARRFRITSAR